MTFTEMQTQLQALGGYGTDTATVQLAVLNAAYRKICMLRPWAWLATTASTSWTPGVLSVNLSTFASNVRGLDSFRISDTQLIPPAVYPLDWVEPRRMRDIRGTNSWPASERDLPVIWSRLASGATDQIAVWPPPDITYTAELTYYQAPAVQVGGDTPLMASTYHDAIVWESIYIMAVRQRDRELASIARAEADVLIAEMRAEDSVGQRQTEATVEQVYDWNVHARRG